MFYINLAKFAFTYETRQVLKKTTRAIESPALEGMCVCVIHGCAILFWSALSHFLIFTIHTKILNVNWKQI